MEVQSDIILSKEGLSMVGMESKLKELNDAFLKGKDKVYLKCTFALKNKKSKTNSQLGYFMGHLAPLALSFLRESGWLQIKTKEDAINFLKEDIGLVETILNEYTGEQVKHLVSLSAIDQNELHEAINLLSALLTENGYTVMDPNEYKKEKKWA